MDVHRGGFHSARQSRGVHSGASTPVTSRDSIARKRRYAEDPDYRQRVACDRRFHATRQDDINEDRGRQWAENPALRTAKRVDHARISRARAQIHLRHVAARLRHAAGAPARRLRHLQGAIRPHALRRSLPRHRTGARAALPRMQSRHRSAQGQSGPVAGGARLSRSRASPVGARREHAPAPLHETTRQARRGVAANWRSAACYG